MHHEDVYLGQAKDTYNHELILDEDNNIIRWTAEKMKYKIKQ